MYTEEWSSLGGSGFAIAIYFLTLLMEIHKIPRQGSELPNLNDIEWGKYNSRIDL